jgi:hypothetical protein
MRVDTATSGAWDSEGLPPHALVRALPIAVLLFALILALPVPASAASVHPAAVTAPSSPAGLAWVHLHRDNVTTPGSRTGAGLSAGPTGTGVLLFGGCGPSECPIADTWEYQAGAWVNLTPSLSIAPSARSGEILAQDPSTGGVLLFGGCAANGSALGDTWLFLNGAWSSVDTSSGAPAARCNASATTDPAGDGVAVFGGIGSTGAPLSDLWLFSSGAWRQMDDGSAGAPVARSAASLSYDSGTGSLVLFGGLTANGVTLSDTDTFSAGHWVFGHPRAPTPAGRTGAVFSDDPALGADLLFGGQNGSTYLGDTWSYSAGVWTNLTQFVAHPPAGRSGASGTYDATDGYELMVGGKTSATGIRNDTWAFVQPLSLRMELPAAEPAPGSIVPFAVAVAGGLPPYHYNWSFGVGGPDVRLAAPYFSYGAAGTYAIGVSVADSRGVVLTANATLTISTAPLSVLLRASPSDPYVGASYAVNALASGGIQPYSASWSGLPAGCAPSAALSVVCTARSTGASDLTVTVTDVHGAKASAALTLYIGPSAATTASVLGGGSAQAFQHWGWVLVPPLAGAVLMAAYAAFATYRVSNYEAVPPTRPDCYVPPEWSETPKEYDPGQVEL